MYANDTVPHIGDDEHQTKCTIETMNKGEGTMPMRRDSDAACSWQRDEITQFMVIYTHWHRYPPGMVSLMLKP